MIYKKIKIANKENKLFNLMIIFQYKQIMLANYPYQNQNSEKYC